jgi:nascent polypeptide-associated complex subunit alpha
MRALPVFFVALLVVTSGCAGFFSGPNPAPDESTTTISADVLPPGVNEQWLYNPDRLMAAHGSVLDRSSYRVRARVTTNTSDWNPEWKRLDLRGHVGDGKVLVDAAGSIRSIGASSPFSFYRWNSSQAVRWSSDSTEYTYLQWPEGERSALVGEQVKRVLTLGDFLVVGTETRDGTEYVRLEANGTIKPNLSDFSATALVSGDGRIRTLSGSLTTKRGGDVGGPSRVSFDYGFRTVDSPPSRPNWVRIPDLPSPFDPRRTDSPVSPVPRTRASEPTVCVTFLPVRSDDSGMFGGGGGGLDPRKMQQMMKQMGIEVDDIEAEEVVIRTADGEELVFSDPDVTRMDARGQHTYQVVGDAETREASGSSDSDSAGSAEESTSAIPDADVEIVAQRAGATEDEAREALDAVNGDLAAAIERLE